MSTYLDFDSTKKFRNHILSKTLSRPNGPQTFTSNNYLVNNLNVFSNIEQGGPTVENETNLLKTKGTNIFKPIDFLVIDSLSTLPRRANLNLYPHFTKTRDRTLVGIMSSSNYDDESELFKFASSHIKNDPNGPVFSRLKQNLYAATAGRVRILDALQGNTSTAINIVTGKEPLIELNNRITVSSTAPGKVIDFLQTVAGVEFPWAEIPGDYLSNPRNPINHRPSSKTELGNVIQDITGSLGSLIGIQRRPKIERKPSDLFIEYMGEGQKQVLFDNLSYSKYAPNYTTVARSQNSSKLFNFVDRFGSGVKNLLGLEAPNTSSYIGDDRGNDVKFAMNDFNDRPVRSNYYLSLLFDPIQTELFNVDKNYTEGGRLSGNLTWISSKSKNKRQNSSDFQQTLSTNFGFREDSILGYTQEILESLPMNGKEMRSHVANVIDQTSRVFKEGEKMLSRGSAIKYVNKFSGEESGVEFCRVWTKDSGYIKNSNLQKNVRNIRKEENSVLSTPYNINMYPNSNGNSSFDNTSTNIKRGADGFFAKKYMFSIENLAWKTSNTPGFSYTDLPECERGNNGGRVMWFPPYDLKISEQNNAEWESNTFLGRPEPIYTYKSAARNGSISFKVIVDHPSVLNLLVKKHFEKMSDEESDNYINAFFSGCENVDLYDLIREYPTLTRSDLDSVLNYLNGGLDPTMIEKYSTEFLPVKDDFLSEETNPKRVKGLLEIKLFFDNDQPKNTQNPYVSNENYDILVKNYLKSVDQYRVTLLSGIDKVYSYPNNSTMRNNDLKLLNGSTAGDITTTKNLKLNIINENFENLSSEFEYLKTELGILKNSLKKDEIKQIRIKINSTSSSPHDAKTNMQLSYRRTYSVLSYVLDTLSLENNRWKLSWGSTITDFTNPNNEEIPKISFEDLGYPNKGYVEFDITKNSGETLKENLVFHTKELNLTAPIMFNNRHSLLDIGYEFKEKQTDKILSEENINTSETPKVNIMVEKIEIKRKPPQDEIKKIIMKTLSECYYFQKMEEETPLIFKSLKEKFKYFHPSFHSMTPEGLNSRLTFLLQCLRPGSTIPIKGISDVSDLNARNTTFGPPPICVLRVGDFFNSKIVIRDVNISYDDSPWDLNPEGIGIQPMIANVQLQVSFIGGQGLDKPVEKLQNALSSNFYANTEMYDYRSESKVVENKFTKEFLEQIVKNAKPNDIPNTVPTNTLTTGEYIGTLNSNDIDYTQLINNTFLSSKKYFNTYSEVLETIYLDYGPQISSLVFSKTFRKVNEYDVNTDTGIETIELLGIYDKNHDLTYFVDNFKKLMNNKINVTNITSLFDLDKDLDTTKQTKSEIILKTSVNELVLLGLDHLINLPNIGSIEKTRNEIINNLDKLNFLVETSFDGKFDDEENVTGANLTDFNKQGFFSKYNPCIEYIKNNHVKFTEKLDNSFDFGSPSTNITDEQLMGFLSILLKDKKELILTTYQENDEKTFDEKTLFRISKRLDKVLSPKLNLKINIGKFPNKINNEGIHFIFNEESNIFTTEQIEKLRYINSTKVNVGEKLNFYK